MLLYLIDKDLRLRDGNQLAWAQGPSQYDVTVLFVCTDDLLAFTKFKHSQGS